MLLLLDIRHDIVAGKHIIQRLLYTIYVIPGWSFTMYYIIVITGHMFNVRRLLLLLYVYRAIIIIFKYSSIITTSNTYIVKENITLTYNMNSINYD